LFGENAAIIKISSKRRCTLSSSKDKFLVSAQKFIQKGQFDRALRDYEQVVTADPKDVKHRQKLAELMVRCNRKDDAIREYETIAKYYDENGFYLKSIAVYKQIQRLDPSNIQVSLCLAALNEKQGMIGNALSEYKILFDHYQKQGQTGEAIDILRKMQGVDPENADIRLKLAETLFAGDLKDEAYQEFTRAALILKNRGSSEIFDRVCRKIHDLFPDRTDSSVFDILTEQLRNGVVGDAIPKLQKILADDPDNLTALDLLAEAYRLSADKEGRKGVLQRLLDLSPADIAPKKNLIQCSVEQGDLEGGVALLDRYLSDLLTAGAYGELEYYYTTLQNHAPYDIRLLDGLKKLYELTGEASKLADVQVSLNILSQKEQPQEAGLGDVLAVESAGNDKAGSDDSPWGDEIDLSLAGDVDSESDPEMSQVGSVEFGDIELSSEDVIDTVSAQQDFEIDISFELPDEGEVFAPTRIEFEEPALTLDTALPTAMEQNELLPWEHDSEQELVAELSLADEGAAEDFSPGEASAWEDDAPSAPLEQELPDAFKLSLDEPVSLAEMVPEDSADDLFELPDGSIPSAADTSEAYSISPATVFERFKESGVQESEHADAETHYSLGIAYMEMGLQSEAINEFRISANDPDRELDSLTLQGVCFRDRCDYSDAEELFTALLSLSGLDADRLLALRYELGLLYEISGRRDEALQVFRQIFGSNPGFRDTMQKIAHLSGNESSFDLSDLDDVDIELEELE
jgi:tetratricopeptide (TPR) repeat protein